MDEKTKSPAATKETSLKDKRKAMQKRASLVFKDD
jgi:hypothetical protein